MLLQSILEGEGMSQQEFFEKIWQYQAYLFRNVSKNGRGTHRWHPTEETKWEDIATQDDGMKMIPWSEMVRQGWTVLSDLLETAESDASTDDDDIPLVLRNLEVLPVEERLASYGTSLFSAYLGGCSVVLNHADFLSPYIASLCEDLQVTFPHAFANCYLTPPNSQTVPAHADDRDVLVLQLVGSKDWQVFRTVPVPYPSSHEQVGKAGIPVPKHVLEGPLALSIRLEPGDVLYVPRGMVHQAQSTPESPSFHVTVALATHDWTLAGNLGRVIQTTLNEGVDFRRSLLPMIATSTLNSIQSDIDRALEKIRREVSATVILKDMEARIENHNRRALARRTARIHQSRLKEKDRGARRARRMNSENAMDALVGPRAAMDVSYSTIVRAATALEKEHAQGIAARAAAAVATSAAAPPSVHARGLNVRVEIGDRILQIVSKVKADSTRSYRVVDLRHLSEVPNPLVCDLSLLSLAKRAVELGAFAVVVNDEQTRDNNN